MRADPVWDVTCTGTRPTAGNAVSPTKWPGEMSRSSMGWGGALQSGEGGLGVGDLARPQALRVHEREADLIGSDSAGVEKELKGVAGRPPLEVDRPLRRQGEGLAGHQGHQTGRQADGGGQEDELGGDRALERRGSPTAALLELPWHQPEVTGGKQQGKRQQDHLGQHDLAVGDLPEVGQVSEVDDGIDDAGCHHESDRGDRHPAEPGD